MGIVHNVKEIADLIKKIGDVELYRKIVELEGEVIELTRKNRDMKDELSDLHKTLSFSDSLEFRAPFYWAKKDDTPYCPTCWEDQKKAIHMVLTLPESNYYNCPLCEFGAEY